jgi:hypothetical protein
MACTAAGRALERDAGRGPFQPDLRAARPARRPFVLHAPVLQSDRAAQRGLPLPQCLDHCHGRRQAACDGVDSRRWVCRRLGRRRNLRWRRVREERRLVGFDQLSGVEVRLPGVTGTVEGIGPSRLGQLWSARPDRGTAMGKAEHRRFRRRPRQRHHLRAVCGVEQHDVSDGIAAGKRAFPPRNRGKRRRLCGAGRRLAARPHVANASGGRSFRHQADGCAQSYQPRRDAAEDPMGNSRDSVFQPLRVVCADQRRLCAARHDRPDFCRTPTE